MLDSLDLQELQERGQKYITDAKRKRRPAYVIGIIVLLIGIILQIKYQPDGSFYWQDGQAWEQPKGDSAFWQLEYSDSGVLWTIDWDTKNLHRYDNGKWTQLDAKDFGTNYDDVQAFTVNRDEVWAVVEADIAHFNGNEWQAHHDILSIDYIAGIAAGDYGVVIADYEGNLITFDGRNWQHNQFIEVLPDYTNDDSYTSLIGDGDSAWLSANALWRYDGQSWKVIDTHPEQLGAYTYLNGIDEDFVYLSSYAYLIAYDKATYQMESMNVEEAFGYPEDARYLYHAERRNDLLWVSIDNQLYTFDGERWSLADNTQPPLRESHRLWDFTFAPDGSVIVGALNPDAYYGDNSWQIMHFLFLICGAPGLLTAIFLYTIFAQGAQNSARAALVRKRLPILLPDMHEYTPLHSPKSEKKPRRNFLLLLIYMGLLVVIPPMLGASTILGLLVVVIGTVLWYIVPMSRHLLDSENDAESRAYLWRNMLVFSVIVGITMLIIVALLLWVIPLFVSLNLPLLVNSLIIYSGVLLLMYGLFGMWSLIPSYYVLQPLKQGNYDMALQRVEQLRKFMPNYLNFMIQHGFILVVRGDYEAAKEMYQEILTEAQNAGPHLVAPMLCNYAIALRETGQTDEALQMIEAAVKILPEWVLGYRTMAEFYFMTGQFPNRALEVTSIMMEFAKKPRFNVFFGRYEWSYTLGVRAVTLANVGRFDEADAIFGQALSETDRNYRPGLALLHLYEALIAKAKGDMALLQEAVDKAVTMDAESAAAKLAQRLLTEG